MEPYFNLVDEPWIPVLRTDGSAGEASLLEVFEQAESIRQLHGELPTMRPAVLRILVVILARAVGLPRNPEDWEEKYDRGWAPVVEAVREYLSRHRDRFWLRHPHEPFFQVADLGPENGATKGLGAIVADFPTNVAAFTQRGPASLERMSPAEAARWLVHTQAYDTSGIKTPDRRDPRQQKGKVYPQGTAWLGKGEVLVVGYKTLMDALRLNCVAPDYAEVITGPADLPPWERTHPGPCAEFETPAQPEGFLQVYSWQARRVRLVFEDEDVTQVVLCYGDPLAEQSRQKFDPMMTWRYSKPQSAKFKADVFMPGIVDPSKDVWRSFAAWLPTRAQKAASDGPPPFLEPGVLRWVGALAAADKLPLEFMPDIGLYGVQYGPQSATFADLVDESLEVPPFLLDPEARDSARTVLDAIKDADTVAWYLGTFAVNLARSRGVDEAVTPRTEARERAYQEFGAAFSSWLKKLKANTEWTRARRAWQQKLRSETRALAQELADESGEEAYIGRMVDQENGAWMNVQIAEGYLYRGLQKTLTLAFKEDNDDHRR
ncbi:type I-E CRISPR-associated protein Cse1/CasA [Brevibacterium album]|uniref:type I-E CRISPR-associated protein Cse1/CasA n=1 Tax=Brevibacterium album TaxID=417948 RepID=UPI00146FB8C0|nr:type I-E CRISPR-associated protein Cse1/CasA [Brevibacterium album]